MSTALSNQLRAPADSEASGEEASADEDKTNDPGSDDTTEKTP